MEYVQKQNLCRWFHDLIEAREYLSTGFIIDVVEYTSVKEHIRIGDFLELSGFNVILTCDQRSPTQVLTRVTCGQLAEK